MKTTDEDLKELISETLDKMTEEELSEFMESIDEEGYFNLVEYPNNFHDMMDKITLNGVSGIQMIYFSEMVMNELMGRLYEENE